MSTIYQLSGKGAPFPSDAIRSKKLNNAPQKSSLNFAPHGNRTTSPNSSLKSRKSQSETKSEQLSLQITPNHSKSRLALSIAPVPERQAIAPNRFLIVALEGDSRRWESPVQLTELEARSLLPHLQEISQFAGVGALALALEQAIDSLPHPPPS